MHRLVEAAALRQRQRAGRCAGEIEPQQHIEHRTDRPAEHRWPAPFGVHRQHPAVRLRPALQRGRDHRKIARGADHRLGHGIGGAVRIDRPASQPSVQLPLRNIDARGGADERKGIRIRQALVEMNEPCRIFERVHHVIARHALRPAEPAQLRHIAIARHHPQPAVEVLMMYPVIAAGAQPIEIGGGRIDREQDVMLGDREIVHHRAIGRVEPGFAHQRARGIDHQIGDRRAGEARRLVAKGIHRAAARIDADMRGERFGFQRAAKIVTAQRFQSGRIDAIGAAVLLGHQQAPGVPHRGGVGDGAVQPCGFGPVGERIAVLAEQRVACRHLGLVTRGADIADRGRSLAPGKADGRDHPVGRKDRAGIGHERGKRRIGHRAEKRARHIGGDRARNRQVRHRIFGALRRVQPDIFGRRRKPGSIAVSHRSSPCSRRHRAAFVTYVIMSRPFQGRLQGGLCRVNPW